MSNQTLPLWEFVQKEPQVITKKLTQVVPRKDNYLIEDDELFTLLVILTMLRSRGQTRSIQKYGLKIEKLFNYRDRESYRFFLLLTD